MGVGCVCESAVSEKAGVAALLEAAVLPHPTTARARQAARRKCKFLFYKHPHFLCREKRNRAEMRFAKSAPRVTLGKLVAQIVQAV